MSFPYLSDLIKALTGYDLPLPIPMFGLCVATALIVASTVLRNELRRRHATGQIPTAKVVRRNAQGGKVLVDVSPEEIVLDFTCAVMIAGLVGARLFHILEHLNLFFAHPRDMILSTSGLSIFGGLIFGTIVGIICVRRWQLPFWPLLDATAPSMMLGYALGRIGCQISGDGDWGIPANMALKPEWLPTWFWAQTYNHNIYGEVIPLPGVYPTPIYETMMAFGCFLILWAIRKKPYQAGWLFSVYLILAGIERFLVEQIRVNPVFDFGGAHLTQAELIAMTIFALGLLGVSVLYKQTSFVNRNER
jgi:phosphatidylglycerol:prolipoprotein diacylglycerol transferase